VGFGVVALTDNNPAVEIDPTKDLFPDYSIDAAGLAHHRLDTVLVIAL
jgi:hypothetical protein